MVKTKYPRIGRCEPQRRWIALPAHEGPRCIVCGAKATHQVHVEFDYFRGDDEVVKACGNHAKEAKLLADAWWTADQTKRAAAVVPQEVK